MYFLSQAKISSFHYKEWRKDYTENKETWVPVSCYKYIGYFNQSTWVLAYTGCIQTQCTFEDLTLVRT